MPSLEEDPREPEFDAGPQYSWPRLTPVVRWLIWANVIVFALFEFLRLASPVVCERTLGWFELNTPLWRADFPLAPYWQLVTYGFLHSLSDPFHILFNLLGLYFFGTLLEGLIGSRRYAAFYTLALVVGGSLQLVYSLAFAPETLVLGASGGVLATIAGAAVLRPRTRVVFILFPLSLKVLALIMVGLDLFNLVLGEHGQVALVVHLGGAAWGFCALRFGWIWADPVASWRERQVRKEAETRQDESERLDRLLAQIHEKGMQSLSARDREFLRRVSSRR